MEKSSKNLKEKVLFLMCLGALTGNISTEVYAQTSDKYHYNINGDKKIEDEIIISSGEQGIFIDNENKENNSNNSGSISFEKNVEIKKNNLQNSIYVQVKSDKSGKVIFKKNLIITNKSGYALYSNTSSSSGSCNTAIIAGDINNPINKIQIIGNLKAESYSKGKPDSSHGTTNSFISLTLNNEKSFFAGKMETAEIIEKTGLNASAFINLNLKNEATWYAHKSNTTDTYTVDRTNKDLRTFITSNGGIIDIYNSAPNEARTESEGTRIFKLDKVGKIVEINKDKDGKDIITEHKNNLPNTTFRISSDVENKKSDKIVFSNADINDSATYYIQIAADPFKGKEWKADENNKIYVMDIENKGNGQIDVKGKEYTKETGAGLVEQIITPTIKKDDKNTETDKEKWYLTSINKIENKGSGHIFAEIGAAANAGMASAWRTDSGDLYQRMGNLRNNEAEQGVWGRIYTGENEVRKGIGLDLEYRAVQVGYDRKQNIDGGKLFTGIAFGYFDGNADYDHGSGESNSATVGMYAAYLGTNGSYGDFIVKLGNIDNELSYSSESGDYYKADYDTYGFSADAEYGYRYEFSNDYYIEPLAQLSYIYIADEEYTMNLNGESGAKVSNDDYQSLIGYAGFHYGKKFGDNVAYLRVAAAHEFAGDIDVDARYQDIKVNSSISGEDTWVEYGVGFDVKVKEDTAVYGRLQKSTGDVVKNKWYASVGIRYTF